MSYICHLICMKPRCQVCDILDTRNKLQIPGTSSTILPGNYNCDSCNIVYLLMCSKCDSGNYIGETSNILWLRLNNHKKSIRDNSRVFPVSVHFNLPDHSLKNLRCVILRGDFKTTADRLICEQTLIHKFKTHSNGVNQDLSFLSPYSYFHQCCRPLTSMSNNNTEVWRRKLSDVFFIRIYWQYTTEEGHRSVRNLWSFNYRFIGLKCHNYALYMCFIIYIYIYRHDNNNGYI